MSGPTGSMTMPGSQFISEIGIIRAGGALPWNCYICLYTRISIMDDITAFIGKIESELDGLPQGSIKPETVYRELPGWSSMYALILMALAETEYDVTLTGQDLHSTKTIGELHKLISLRC